MVPPSEHQNDDPHDPKLPPLKQETGQTDAAQSPAEAVSPKLKYFVIGLTFFTIMAFGLFAALVVKRFFISPAEQVTWGPQLVTIAEELKNSGLKVQAIEQYQKYLDTQEVSLTTRSHISNEILKLHVELGQCDEAAVWHLHSKTAQPTALWVKESETLLQQCQKQKKP